MKKFNDITPEKELLEVIASNNNGVRKTVESIDENGIVSTYDIAYYLRESGDFGVAYSLNGSNGSKKIIKFHADTNSLIFSEKDEEGNKIFKIDSYVTEVELENYRRLLAEICEFVRVSNLKLVSYFEPATIESKWSNNEFAPYANEVVLRSDR